MRRLTPEERLNAFLEHCQLLMELYNAGREQRKSVSSVLLQREGAASPHEQFLDLEIHEC
jgi:hypothetical protein